jgi:hypothetical protein
MESNFRNRDFEQYVKQNADQYRMFPSEKVWKNIHGTLHTRRKWYGFGLALLLLSTVTAVTWVMISYPVSESKKVIAITPSSGEATASQSASSPAPSTESNTPDLPFTSRRSGISSTRIPVAGFNSSSNTGVTQEQEEAVGQTVPISVMNAGAEREQFSAIISSPRISSATSNTHAIVNAPASEKTESAGINDYSVDDPARKDSHGAAKTSATASVQQEHDYPLTIESVVNTYQRSRKRLNWQLYVTPTVSYRKLAANKSLDNITAPNYPFALSSMSDVNEAVTHKPDMGVQVGLSAGYPITKSLRVRAGFQFNISRYDIKASLNNPVQAPFDLNVDNGQIDPVREWTYYRNYSGNKSDWLKNYYFSVSFPIGVEMTLLGNQKTNVGVAGTIQPTYTIKDRAYMISTDFKNYATIPWLMRNVNVSTGFEAYVNYTSGTTRWQIGPQVRYQILSSFHNKYPVKENLFDFGVKIGVSLNQ